jgi:hypothetical protein
MNKQIISAAVRGDKTISFSLIEPFYCAFFQNFISLGHKPALQCNFPHIFFIRNMLPRDESILLCNGGNIPGQPPFVNKKLHPFAGMPR